MTDETPQAGTPEPKPDANSLEALSPAELSRMVRALRDESAAHRVKAKEALAKLSELESAQAAADQQRAKEQGDYKALYEALQVKAAEQSKAQADLEERIRRMTVETLRARVGAETGLPPALVARLTGETEDEIRADAESLKAALGSAGNGAGAGRAPAQTTQVPGGQAATSIAEWLRGERGIGELPPPPPHSKWGT